MRKARSALSVRWCDVNKGDRDNMVIRSRLVGREFRWKDPFMQGTFAATPPLESLKYVSHWIQTRRRRHGRKLDIKLLVLDVSRAHFHPPAVRELFFTLPDEDATPGMVGQLLRTLGRLREYQDQCGRVSGRDEQSMPLRARYRTIYRLEAWRRHFGCRRGGVRGQCL